MLMSCNVILHNIMQMHHYHISVVMAILHSGRSMVGSNQPLAMDSGRPPLVATVIAAPPKASRCR